MKKILGCMRRASTDFGMINSGDRIAIGISGGKDSMLLARAFSIYKRFIDPTIEVCGITVDLGFEGFDTSIIGDYMDSLEIPYYVTRTEIGDIVFNVRRESNPCALCAKMRKGAFYDLAKSKGFSKAAYAHQREDVIETLLMSLFYEGRINTFQPVTYLSRVEVTLIRPFIYLPEKDVTGAVRKYQIPIHKNPCPACGKTKREEIKELIFELQKKNPRIREYLLSAIKNTENYNLWDKYKKS